MITHETTYRVTYGDTDQMGYMYYGEIPKLYEIGRTEMIRSFGIAYKTLESELGIMMPVTEMKVRYVRPAKYDDLLQIKTTLRKLPERHIVFHTEVYNENAELLNAGYIALVFVDRDSQQVVPIPAYVKEAIEHQF